MREIGCADLARAGAWALADCCVHCHQGKRMAELALDDGGSDADAVHLLICCNAGVRLEMSKLMAVLDGLTGPPA